MLPANNAATSGPFPGLTLKAWVQFTSPGGVLTTVKSLNGALTRAAAGQYAFVFTAALAGQYVIAYSAHALTTAGTPPLVSLSAYSANGATINVRDAAAALVECVSGWVGFYE